MLTNELNMRLLWWAWVEKTDHGVETHWLSGKKNIPVSGVSKEDHADNLLGHEKTDDYWFPWKRCNCILYFLLSTSSTKFTLFI